MDQIIGQACRNGWTVGVTRDDLVGDQCAAVVGLHPRDDQWLEYPIPPYGVNADARAGLGVSYG